MTKVKSDFQKLKAVTEGKKVLAHLKAGRLELQRVLKSRNRSEEIQKYANRWTSEAKKRVTADVARVRFLLDRARVKLEGLQGQYLNPRKKIKETIDRLRKAVKPKRVSRKSPAGTSSSRISKSAKVSSNEHERPSTNANSG